MEPFNEQQKTDFLQRIEKAFASRSELTTLLDFLPNCEYELIIYMVQQNAWKGAVPLPPDDFTEGEGSIEFGLFLYWFNHVEDLHLNGLSEIDKLLVRAIIVIVANSKYLQDTKMNSENYAVLSEGGLIYVDGTVLGTKTYETYDQGWFTAFINLFISLAHNLWYNDGHFPNTIPQRINLVGAASNSVSIAIIGDWGAANPASIDIMNHIKNLKTKPDYIVHVGDVYYAGTPLKTSPHGDKYLAPGEEVQNLINLWPSEYAGKSFTMNSNHEMYSGANGLFYDAFGVNNNFNTPFSSQKGASCFSLEFGGWTLLGLDSAFKSPITTAFMTGSIGKSSGVQHKWIQSLNLNPNKTIVLSHHNGFADDCTSVSPLWYEINAALKGDPFAWYWGHVHNGIVYEKPISMPVIPGGTNKFETETFARCLGHAALPYGVASSLENKPIAWKANSPKPAPSNELYNGYAVITMTTDAKNVLNSITERFYDLSTTDHVYEKQLL